MSWSGVAVPPLEADVEGLQGVVVRDEALLRNEVEVRPRLGLGPSTGYE